MFESWITGVCSLGVILHNMWSGKSLQLLCILLFGMLCLSAISMMFVKSMWSELLMRSVFECQRVECAFTSPVRTECGMLWASAGHVGGTRGSGIVSSAADVLWMSVVRGMRHNFHSSL